MALAEISGTIISLTTNEEHIVLGGRTIRIILSGGDAFWGAAVGGDNSTSQALIDGIDSNKNESNGWDQIVKAGLVFSDIDRQSESIVVITLPAFLLYNIVVDEVITVTVPDEAYNDHIEAGGGGGDPGDPGAPGELVFQIGAITFTQDDRLIEEVPADLALSRQIGDITIVLATPIVLLLAAEEAISHQVDDTVQEDAVMFTALQSEPETEVKWIHIWGDQDAGGAGAGSGVPASVIPRVTTSCSIAEEGFREHAGGPFNPQGTLYGSNGNLTWEPLTTVADMTDMVVRRTIEFIEILAPVSVDTTVSIVSVTHT